MNPADITRANELHTPPSRSRHDGEVTPGSWSTAATPGSPIGPGEFGTPNFEGKGPIVEQGTPSGKGKGSSRLRNTLVNDDSSEDGSTPPSNGGLLFPPKKTVTFTPSAVGGFSSTTESPPPSPTLDPLPDPGEDVNRVLASKHGLDAAHQGFPPGFIPPPPNVRSLVNHAYLGQTISPFSLSPHILPQDASPQAPPPASTNLIPGIPGLPAASHPAYLPNQKPPQHPSTTPLALHFQQPPPPPVALELTPNLIAKAQKHCRFAISALDYEDGEQARKELRAALALLGG
jgi:vacuolar protein sorting-associated protein VTA1